MTTPGAHQKISRTAAGAWLGLLGPSASVVTVEDDRPSVCGWVRLDGAWSGSVAVACEEGGADKIARTMLDLPEGVPLHTADLVDAVGEVANVIAGRLKVFLPAPSAMSLPVTGAGGPPHAATGTSVLRLGLALDGTPAAVLHVLREGLAEGGPDEGGPDVEGQP